MATVTAIEVRRKSAISWVLIPDGVAANDVQEAWWRATRIGNNITFKSTNGAVEFKDINYQFISYVDEVTPANNVASFSSGYECYNYLKEQGFFDVGSEGGGSGTTFIDLDDTPSTYLGQTLKLLRVNSSATAVEFFQKAIASQLSELVDGPGAYSNGKYIKSTASGWEWSDGFNVSQDNKGLVRNYGILNSVPTINDMVAKMNYMFSAILLVSEIQTPIIVYVTYINPDTSESSKYPFLFLAGKGTYGGSGLQPVTASMLFQLPPLNLTPEDIESDPNVSIVNLDPVLDGDFVSKANESFWDFSDSDYQNGGQSYYFSYTDDGVLYYALFIGAPGTYGDGATPFESDDFVDTTNSRVDPDPSDNYILKNPSPETEQTIKGDITITGDIYNEYIKIITVGAGGDYTTLEDLFDDEPSGKTLILLTDASYDCANPKFVIKEGWIIRGQGVGKTRITFTFNTTIDPDTSGLHIRQTCKLEDLEVITVNNVASGGLGQYALHADYSTYSDFKAEINRCSFRTVLSAQSADLNGFNGLTVGIGTWEGQTIEFHDCFIEGAYVTYSDKYTLNVHNKYTASTHIIPSRVSYYNCLMTGGFTTVLISDSYSNDAEPNQNRVQDLYEFINCDISSLWLRSHSQLGTIHKKNGILYNFTGSKVREFLNTAEVVDTSLSNYNIKSLPVTEDVEYLKNIGSTTINAGDFVSYVYANRLPEYHLTSEKTINTIIGIEKLTSANKNNFAGIALATSAVGNFNHFAIGAIAYTSLTSTTINIGDNVTFDASGNLIRANYYGVGTVVKKTYNNRLGIELHPSGKKTNVVGSATWRGLEEIEGNASTVGPPTIRMTDHNSGDYGWQFAVGVNSNSGPGPEIGRFALSDLDKGIERFGISAAGESKLTVRSLSLQNQDIDSDPFSTILLGSMTKPGYFKLVNGYNSGNGFEIYQDSATGRTSINPNSSTLAIAIHASGNVSIGTTTDSGGAKLQLNGRASGSAAVNSGDFIIKSQFDAANRSVIDDSITTMPTAASIEAMYSSVALPYYVIAKNINSGASPTIFIKHSVGVWLFQPLALLT